MDFILKQLNDLGFDTPMFLRSAVLLAIGSIILGALGRFVFGKRSVFHCAVSSAIAILFIYATTIALQSWGFDVQRFTNLLPFVDKAGDQLKLFSFLESDLHDISNHILDMVLLAFAVNLLDGILPRGKNFFVWLLLRIVTIAGSMILLALTTLLKGLLVVSTGFTLSQYAPLILLALLVVLLLVGGLKIVVGAVLTTVNPIIGSLYTFFFANIVGKAITKAILTAGIISALVYLLEYLGITAIPFLSQALVMYIPLILILLLVWFVIGKLFDK